MLLSDVCLSRTSDLSREQRGIGRLKLAQRYPTSHVTRTPLSRSKKSKINVTRPLWLVVLAGQHGHTEMFTYPYAYMTYIVSPLAGLGGGISWRPPAYSLLKRRLRRGPARDPGSSRLSPDPLIG